MDNIIYKDLILSQDEKVCYINKEEVELTPIEYNMLLFFMQNRNKLYSRPELVPLFWDKPVMDRVVDTAVARLRKKLKDYGTCIITRRGFGYGFKENNDD